jgi:SRSO17 transposase
MDEPFSHPADDPFFLDTSLLDCPLADLRPLRIELVSSTPEAPLWDYLVRRYHYLGHRLMVGRSLKYLVYHRRRPIAAVGWRAAALKLEARDRFIGWSALQRKDHLGEVANNNRFLILDWVRIPHLASHILGRMARRVVQDWWRVYGLRLFVLETFVDPRRHRGTMYAAAGWQHVGRSKGYTKKGKEFIHHGHPKEVWLYVVDHGFRERLGYRQQPPSQRLARSVAREGELSMMMQKVPWNPALLPPMTIDEADMRALAQQLVQFHGEFSPFYGRREHHRFGLAYLQGLLSDLERKTAEGISLLLLSRSVVRRMQCFLSIYRWDHVGMLHAYQEALAKLIYAPGDEGMVNVDSSEFRKKGKESVGVARQYCGNLGKVDNCQCGVFVGYASPRGYGLVDCRLYLPDIWLGEEYGERRRKCQIPAETQFRTKLQIALDLLEGLKKRNMFPARWIGCDCSFGSDVKFLDEVGRQFWYFASVRSTTLVWLSPPRMRVPPYKGRGRKALKPRLLSRPAVTVAEVAKDTTLRWQLMNLAEGTKGPIMAEVARIRVIPSRAGMPGKECWLYIRKYPDGELKYALSNAPRSISIRKLNRASTLRWPIEQCFQEGKEQLGMDHYEHRSWPGWHRHMLFIFLAQLFLQRLREQLKKKAWRQAKPGEGGWDAVAL